MSEAFAGGRASARNGPDVGRIVARVVVTLAALLGIAVTLPFAVAFQAAYGSSSEAGFLAASLTPWLARHGLLGFDAAAVYDRYGVAYLVALGLVTACLAVLTPPGRAGRRVLIVGLVVLCTGLLGDYVVPNAAIGGIGFLLEGVGLLVTAVGFGLLVHGQAGVAAGSGAALAALGCMVAGTLATGHIPSGTGLVIFACALVLALPGHPHRREASEGPGSGPR